MQWCKRYLWPESRIKGRFCEHNTRICQISFRILESLNNLFVWSEHFYNDWERFCEFCVKVTMNCHSTNSDKKPCPETLLQGFFEKSGTNRLKFEQINVQKFIKLDQMDLHWFWWHRHLKLQKVSKLVTGIARASADTTGANLHSLSLLWKSLEKFS